MKKNLLVTICLTIGFLLASPSRAQCRDDNSFALSFKKFQEAVKANDPLEVARLTKFPFKARNVLNNEEPMLVSKRQFVRYYKFLMKLDVWDPSGKIVISNLRDYVLSLSPETDPEIKSYCRLKQGRSIIYPGAEIGVEELRFERNKNGNWQLSGGLLGDLYSNIEDGSEPVE